MLSQVCHSQLGVHLPGDRGQCYSMDLGGAAAGKYSDLGLLIICCQDNGTFVNLLEMEHFLWCHSALRFGAVTSQGGRHWGIGPLGQGD